MDDRLIRLREFGLLGLLALLWGSSYLFIRVAVLEIPPITLIATRVTIAVIFLAVVMRVTDRSLPSDPSIWRMLFVQSCFNSTVAWVVLAWGQQFLGAGLASVLNSTSPIFVFLLTMVLTRHESVNVVKLCGVLIGLGGVVTVVGVEVLNGLGDQVAGQLACLAGAFLYACAAIYGKRFHSLGAVVTATGTMLCSCVVLVPAALILERPWAISPSVEAVVATIVLSVFCTALALMLYFRLLKTIGSLGVASQAYLRAGIGVVLAIVFLGESFDAAIAIGLTAAIVGVAMINWPLEKR